MRFHETTLVGAFMIDIDSQQDARGSFGRLYARGEFEEMGLSVNFDYCAVSENHVAGTLRGLHYQLPPDEEAKLIWCLRGAVFDVIVDLRSDSRTHRRWFSVELRPQGPLLYVPKGFAHGFQTLEADSVLQYHIAGNYRRDRGAGIRWDDHVLAISWPIRPPPVISDRDNALPRL